jgi:hypothetical protein
MKNKLEIIKENFNRLVVEKEFINEAGGDVSREVIDLLISKVARAGESTLPKEILTITDKNGIKQVIKNEWYIKLMSKENLTQNELNLIHSINKNIVNEIGTTEIANVIRNSTKNLDSFTAEMAQDAYLTKFFDKNTAKSVENELKGIKPKVSKPRKPRTKADVKVPPAIEKNLNQVADKIYKGQNLNSAIKWDVSPEEMAKINQLVKMKGDGNAIRLNNELIESNKELVQARKNLVDTEAQLNQTRDVAKREELKIKKRKFWLDIVKITKYKILVTLGIYIALFGWKDLIPVAGKIINGESIIWGESIFDKFKSNDSEQTYKNNSLEDIKDFIFKKNPKYKEYEDKIKFNKVGDTWYITGNKTVSYKFENGKYIKQ